MLNSLLLVFSMAFVTYLIRMLPFAFFKKKINNRFIKSLLKYIPYAVLSAMTFPYILYSAGNSLVLGLVGAITAFVLSFFNRSLLTVALSSCTAILIAEALLIFI